MSIDFTRRSLSTANMSCRWALSIDGKPKVILRSSKVGPKRYSLKQLLEGVTKGVAISLSRRVVWASQGIRFGRELA